MRGSDGIKGCGRGMRWVEVLRSVGVEKCTRQSRGVTVNEAPWCGLSNSNRSPKGPAVQQFCIHMNTKSRPT